MTRPDVPATLRRRLAPLAPAVLEIRDDSAAHAGHRRRGRRRRALFAADRVRNLFRTAAPARHQRVLREVADLVPYPIHALSIKALAPEEFPSSTQRNCQR